MNIKFHKINWFSISQGQILALVTVSLFLLFTHLFFYAGETAVSKMAKSQDSWSVTFSAPGTAPQRQLRASMLSSRSGWIRECRD